MADAGRASGHGEIAAHALAYADTLYNLARYLTGSGADAEDLVQETYARAFGAAGQYTPGTNLKAWLFRILRNAYLSQYRRQRASPVVTGVERLELETVSADGGDWLRDDLELDRLRKLVAGEIEQALLTLTEDARSVILLDLEGLSEREIADVMGCPPGTVKSRLARARAALRRRLHDYAR